MQAELTAEREAERQLARSIFQAELKAERSAMRSEYWAAHRSANAGGALCNTSADCSHHGECKVPPALSFANATSASKVITVGEVTITTRPGASSIGSNRSSVERLPRCVCEEGFSGARCGYAAFSKMNPAARRVTGPTHAVERGHRAYDHAAFAVKDGSAHGAPLLGLASSPVTSAAEAATTVASAAVKARGAVVCASRRPH